ncbi:NUDIX hydrolase [Alkalicoccus chagannorensis]|uniref:NUDIX hydrolase n=1 Tax=Alkalicoccus chagannorensis TaxID=427072 RepID=UPI000408FA88|nr:NUDIX domain-containing protein [Alkalicoccus chagannorensis]
MKILPKAYVYVTRTKNARKECLVFRHPLPKGGIQIPKGTIEEGESPDEAAVREMMEETGLSPTSPRFLAEDEWEHPNGERHHRYFFEMPAEQAPQAWVHEPTGGGAEEGLEFSYYWISPGEEDCLVEGFADYLPLVWEEER